jgi:preprotein translocase subunit SecG
MNVLAIGWSQYLVAFFFILICLLLMLVVLLQKGRGGGLSGAFGGVGGHSAFGAKTGDVFTWVTVGLAAAFVLIACIGNFVYQPPKPMVGGEAQIESTGVEEPEPGTVEPTGAEGEPAPAAPAEPAQ